MARSLRDLRRKIKAVQHIRQITRAMKMVATAKLKRIQRTVENSRRYQEELRRLLADVAKASIEADHPYLQAREVERVGVMIVGGDRGLCGAFNRQIDEQAVEFIAGQAAPVEVITVGNRMRRYADRHGFDVVSSHPAVERADAPDIDQIIGEVRSWYESGHVDLVQVVYARFESLVRHPVVNEQLLPLSPQAFAEATDDAAIVPVEYIFEPPAARLLAELLPRALEVEIAQILLTTQASGQAARMTAMSAATDNADEMITDLTRSINRARQEEITAELLDVVTGARALQS